MQRKYNKEQCENTINYYMDIISPCGKFSTTHGQVGIYLYLSIGSCVLLILSSIRSRVDVDTIVTNIITNLQRYYRGGVLSDY